MSPESLVAVKEHFKTLKPNYRVELIVKGKSHKYPVTLNNGQQNIFRGTTGVLNIIAKEALVNWAKKESLKIVERGILNLLGGEQSKSVVINADFIKELVAIAKANPDKQKDDAAKLGTKAHEYIDAVIKGKPLGKIDDDILKPVMGFANWWANAGIEVLMGDTKVASLRHQYGGSLDALGYDTKRKCLVILDWKTAKNIYDTYALQVAAYANAFEETYSIPVGEAVIVRFEKDGAQFTPNGYEPARIRSMHESFAAFLAAKELQERMKFDHLIRD